MDSTSSSSSSSMPPPAPLITICGTTGVGKSKLAIELALHIANRSSRWRSARIINADSMQVYRGMDIITNKVPPSDRHGIEHLLMSFKAPGEQYVVGQWVRDAIEAIGETHAREEVPIVVGGTAYWIQHLLFPGRLSKESFDERSPSMPSPELANAISTLPPHLHALYTSLPAIPPLAATDPEGALNLHALLTHLDPAVASRWHWKDTRKVFRSLEIIKESGRRPSEMIQEQDEHDTTPRFQSLCFWLYADNTVLHPRLDQRVDDMIRQGVLDELNSLHSLSQSPTSESDYTLGIYQSIGYREFHTYLSLPPSQRTQSQFAQAVEAMKISTRQYAKRQISWLRNKLLPAVHASDQGVKVFLLDATDEDKWTETVLDQGIRITDDFLLGHPLPNPTSLSEPAHRMLSIPPNTKPNTPSAILSSHTKLTCEICTEEDPERRPVMIGQTEWERHVRSKAHRRLVDRKRREVGRESEEERGVREEKRRVRAERRGLVA